MTRRCVVVALEAGIPDPELEAAVALARSADAELLGLFVEDLDLLRFAALPFAHEIGTASAARRRLDTASLERELRAHALEAERRLAGVAARGRVPSAFRVARGLLLDVLIAEAAQLAAAAEEEIRLLLLGDGGSARARWTEQVRAELAARESAPRLRVEHAAGAAELGRLQHRLAAPVLIVPVRMLRRL